jgi:hypothetical protein
VQGRRLTTLAEAIDRLTEANAARRKRRALAKPERTLAAAMHTAFRAQERAFLARLALIRGRFSPAPLREAILDLPWEPLFDEAAQATVQAFAAPLDAAAAQALSSGMLAAVADLSIEGSFGLEHPAAVDYLRRRGAERVGQITNTTRTRLRSLLEQAADEGWSYDRTAREIRKQYAGFSATRARNIAVYELGDAYEHGNVLVARDLQDGGLAMEKSWLTVGDDRVRPDHRANQGQGWIPLDDTFGSGDDRPPADPGCRCTLLMRRRPGEGRAEIVPDPVADGPLPFTRSATVAEARERAMAAGAQLLPQTDKEAVETIIDALMRQDARFAGDPVLQKKVRANWTRMLKGNVTPIEDQAFIDVQDALTYNRRNRLYNQFIDRYGEEPVILRIPGPESATGAGAQHYNGFVFYYKGKFYDGWADITAPYPGAPTAAAWGGMPSMLRHEYGHRIYNALDGEQGREWLRLLPEDATIKRDLTRYAATNDSETFTELFALVTDEGYRPEDYAPWVQEAGEWILGLLG